MIDNKQEYWGEVVDVNDPLKSGRIRVRVVTVFDNLAIEHIPWAAPAYQNSDEYKVPHIGANVLIRFNNSDIYFPEWFTKKTAVDINDVDYASAVILLDRNLEDFELGGRVRAYYAESKGIVLELTKDGSASTIELRPDNTVFLRNAAGNKVVHITSNGISLGSENSSSEPGVLGNKNVDALEKLNTNIDQITTFLIQNLQALEIACKASPYTAHLVPILIPMYQGLQSLEQGLKAANTQFFPTTKSQIVTLN